MIWLGIEPVIAARPARSLQLIQQTTFSLVRENIARRLTLEIDRDTEPVEKLLALAAGDPKMLPDILRGVAAALEGRKKPPVLANWSEVSDRLTSFDSADTSDSVNAIGIAFRDAKIISSLRRTVEDPVSRPDERTRALELLLTARPKNLNGVLRGLVKDPNLCSQQFAGWRSTMIQKSRPPFWTTTATSLQNSGLQQLIPYLRASAMRRRL